jgi:hypothetical protein
VESLEAIFLDDDGQADRAFEIALTLAVHEDRPFVYAAIARAKKRFAASRTNELVIPIVP